MKICSACQTSKPLVDFYRNGQYPYCKPCAREKDRARAEQRRERRRAYTEANPEKVKAQRRAGYERRKETAKEARRRYLAKEENKAKQKAWVKAERERVREAALRYYSDGAMSCACCGESVVEFLTIDHINNDGAEHRKQIGVGNRIYRWLRQQGYPEGFQVLCYNCNLAKGKYGHCPHRKFLEAPPSWLSEGSIIKLEL